MVGSHPNQDPRYTGWPIPTACIQARDDIWNRVKAARLNKARESSPSFDFPFTIDQYACPKERVV